MINVAIFGLATETIAEGFRLNVWRDEDLIALQKQLQEINLLPPVIEAFQMEVVSLNRICEQNDASYAKFYRLLTEGFSAQGKEKPFSFQKAAGDAALWFAPRGWVYQNQLAYNQLIRKAWRFSYNIDKQILNPTECGDTSKIVEDFLIASGRSKAWLLYEKPAKRILAATAIPNITRAMRTAARNQARVSLALTACALEQYRHAHGEYPETLDALASQFIEKIPHDIIGGEPLKYRRTVGGKFLLYSIGWNEKDDGGKFVRGKDGTVDPYASEDWVWAAK